MNDLGRRGETDLEIAVSVQKEIGRFEITMEDVGGVKSLERAESLERGAESASSMVDKIGKNMRG